MGECIEQAAAAVSDGSASLPASPADITAADVSAYATATAETAARVQDRVTSAAGRANDEARVLLDPGDFEEDGRGLQVVDVIAAAWGSFRAGHAQVVWCDLGEPPDSAAASDTWARLRAVIATVALGPAAAAAIAAGHSPARSSASDAERFAPA